MSINTITPYAFLALLAFPSCVTVEEDPSSAGSDAGATDDSSNVSDRDTDEPDTAEGDDSTRDDQSSSPDGGAGEQNDSSDPTTTSDDTWGDTTNGPNGGDTGSDATGEEPDPGTNLETASFFLPTVDPDNTVSPRIRIDSEGGVHALYAAYAGGGAYYAYCASGCSDSDAFEVVYLPTDGTVSNAMLSLTAEGQPRVLLSGFLEATYATCDSDCSDEDNWKTGVILEHGGDQEISGQAFALDAEGKPHFLVHTYRAYFNIGQKAPATHYATCESGDCTSPGDWSTSQIAEQIWEEGQLQFDSQGNAHLAFVAVLMEDLVTKGHISAYATCSDGCTTSEDWPAVGLANTYLDNLEAISLSSSIAMALTRTGKPRLVTLAKSEEGAKQLIYFECDANCTKDGFQGSILSDHPDINVGLSLALDRNDRPRFVHTLNYNIALAYCDDLPCSDPEAPWNLEMVEASGSIPRDEIILWPNCSVAAWFLHTPALELDAAGNPVVGYQARDISGGVHNADPTKPDCVAGTDMTLTRMTQMAWQ